MAARKALSSGGCENFTYTSVPPRKSTPYGMWCQNNMENRPATLNTSEKARKYHFFPRKSILVLRKNSTGCLAPYLNLKVSSFEFPVSSFQFPVFDLPPETRNFSKCSTLHRAAYG